MRLFPLEELDAGQQLGELTVLPDFAMAFI